MRGSTSEFGMDSMFESTTCVAFFSYTFYMLTFLLAVHDNHEQMTKMQLLPCPSTIFPTKHPSTLPLPVFNQKYVWPPHACNGSNIFLGLHSRRPPLLLLHFSSSTHTHCRLYLDRLFLRSSLRNRFWISRRQVQRHR